MADISFSTTRFPNNTARIVRNAAAKERHRPKAGGAVLFCIYCFRPQSRWQAAIRPGATSRMSGSSSEQRSLA